MSPLLARFAWRRIPHRQPPLPPPPSQYSVAWSHSGRSPLPPSNTSYLLPCTFARLRPSKNQLAAVLGGSIHEPFPLIFRPRFLEEFMLASYKKSLHAAFAITFLLALGLQAYAQSGSSGSINGTVLDPTGAVVANATVEIHNPVSHFDRSTTTDNSGKFTFPNVPFNPYHMTVTAAGFASACTGCAGPLRRAGERQASISRCRAPPPR